MRWYAVYTKPRGEEQALSHLQAQGFRCFLPRLRKTRTHARRRDVVLEPLFPRYLFTSFDLAVTRWRAINGSRGVVQVLTQNDVPLSVPKGIVETILHEVDEHGVTNILTVLGLAAGSKVRINSGPFEGKLAEVRSAPTKGSDRVALLLEILGKDASLQLPAHLVEPV